LIEIPIRNVEAFSTDCNGKTNTLSNNAFGAIYGQAYESITPASYEEFGDSGGRWVPESREVMYGSRLSSDCAKLKLNDVPGLNDYQTL
jgi:hypothetical protein